MGLRETGAPPKGSEKSMTNNTEKKSESKPEVTIEALFEAYNATVKEANISESAQKALDFAKQFNTSVFDLPIPEEVKTELKAIEECTSKKEAILRSIHERYDALMRQRDEITSKMDAIQAFLKRTTGKTSGKIGRPRKTTQRGSGATVTGIWHVSPVDIMKDVEVEVDENGEPKAISTGYIKSVCPICGEVLAGGYNSAKQHIARHKEAEERGWVSW
jgi:hypothetical protein